MKSYHIFIFIISTLFTLSLLSLIFPKDGLQVNDLTLRFPSLEEMILERDTVKEVDEIMALPVSIDTVKINELADSLKFYKEVISTNPGRFHLPDHDFTYFDSLFEDMENAQSTEKVIRILHYGDSQIEMDRISRNLRKFLQGKFGGEGVGLLPLFQIIHSSSIQQRTTGEATGYSVYDSRAKGKDKKYGILGKYYQMSGNVQFSASAVKSEKTTTNLRQFSKITLLFHDVKGGFNATLTDETNQITIKQSNDSIGLSHFVWQLDTPTTKIKLSLSGAANIYGVMLDGNSGISVDNIPVRGSSGTFFTQIDDASLAAMYTMSDVGLIILQFGGNSMPVINTEKGVAGFKERVGKQISYIRNLYPQAKILYIGPSDMSTRVNGVLRTYTYLPNVNQALQEAALENGAAYWDMYHTMGGENSMIHWVNNGFAGKDYIHFTPAGADKIGEALSNTFSIMFDFYNMRKTTPDIEFEQAWQKLF